jgi:putative phage-type endonuclease
MIEQGTNEWHQMRLGKVTASKIADVMATIKTGEAAVRINYRAQLVAERLTGSPTESFSNSAMAWGTEHEPMAREAYERKTGYIVEQVAFVDHPIIPMTGASPDGLIDDDGLLECKCPNTATHIDTLLAGKAPAKYILQMQWQMACTGRKWCDFVSFDPRLPEDLQLAIYRVERDDALIAEYEYKVREFLQSVDDTINKLEELRK